MVAVVAMQMEEETHQHGDWGADGGGQEKVLKLLLKLRARSRKEDGARVIGCWPKSNANDGLPSCENRKTNELEASYGPPK